MMNRFAVWVVSGICALSSAYSVEIQTMIKPRLVTAGEPAELTLSHAGAGIPEFARGTPDIKGIRWYGSSSSSMVHFINGRFSRTGNRTYTFIVYKPGKYVIPALEVHAGTKRYTSRRIEFTVRAPSLTVPPPDDDSSAGNEAQSKEAKQKIEDLIYSQTVIPGKQTAYRIGEEIPLEVSLYVADGLNVQIGYPEISMEKANVAFRDYKAENPENPRFEKPVRSQVRIHGRRYIRFTFRTAFRALSAETLKPQSSIRMEIRVPSPQRQRRIDPFFDDDFFGDMFTPTRSIQHNVSSAAKEIRIDPLPPQTGNAKYLGLIGDWHVRTEFSTDQSRVGEAVTMTLHVSVNGEGSFDSLKAPILDFPGFRTYPPEIERAKFGSSAAIRYTLIPMEQGNRKIAFSVSTFDSAAGKYVETKIAKTLEIGAAPAGIKNTGGPRVFDAEQTSFEQMTGSPETQTKLPKGVLYLKKPSEITETQIPLWRNSWIWYLLITLGGAAVWIVCELVWLRKRIRANDPGILRKEAAGKRKAALLKMLKNTVPEQLVEKEAEIASYIYDALDMAPGSTLEDAAEKLQSRDPELAGILKTMAAASWRPDFAGADFTVELKKKLICGLGHLVCLALIFAAFSVNAAVTTEEQAMSAYDNGHFQEALDYYRRQNTKSKPSAEILYNIGNCQYQLGHYAEALAMYARAQRLSPRDSDITENMNLTLRKLGLPGKYRIETPSDVVINIRDSLRPDEWCILLSVGLALVLAGFGLRHFCGRKGWLSIVSAGTFVILLAAAAIVWQTQTSYAENQGIITGRNIMVRALPSATAPALEAAFIPGEEVHIEEQRSGWIRVRSGAAEGWILSKYITKL